MKRKLKIEEFNRTGKYRARPGSTIRIKGQWLHQLGFLPGQSVELTAVSPGVLEIRLCGSPREDKSFTISAMRLDHAIAADEARKARGA